MKNKIYTISTAHLDTSWLWTQKETIEIYLPRTLNENFELFEKFSDYKFNFEGAYRYELIEEYHPEEFKKLKEYVKKGNWNLCGSCYENGDTNIPSPEALIRNVLYGNSYFFDKFNKKSNDIFLPDCFGFGRALPSVMTSCGLIGFSTQKLSWGSSIEPPFEIGKWKALDGSFVYTSMKPGNYSTKLKEVRCKWANDKLEENIKTSNIPFTMTYYGTGDRGGSPHPIAFETIVREINENKNDENTEVISGSMVEFFNDLKVIDEKQGTLLEFDKEFLMSTHGVGSYTSRAASKRLNKKCENLLDISEKANSLSAILGYKEYPQEQFNFAWKRVLEHHFHDDITGTSFMECYEKNWNDYFLALNNAKDEYISAIASVESKFNTIDFANPIMVFNPNQDDTVATIRVDITLPYKNVKVVDYEANEYQAYYKDNVLYFNALIKGNTLKVFDVVNSIDTNNSKNTLSISEKKLENERYKVLLDENFDISSIYDKEIKKELLASPIRYNLLKDLDSIQWPAWEIKYSDIIRSPYGYFKAIDAKIIEDNFLRVSIQINKEFNNSTLKEVITLDKGSNRIDVYNELIWHEDCANLKISFPLSIKSDHGTYDIGIAKYNRGNNKELLYEVPAQKFAKIEEGNIGVTILSDSKQGFDKPTDNEIRLTIVHSANSNYRHECAQHLLDFGLNIFSYSITSSFNYFDNSISEAEKFTKPINAFKMTKHVGQLRNDINLFTLSNNDARVMCFKKAMYENKYVLRVVDYFGNSLNDVKVEFLSNIKSLYLIRGDEEVIKELKVKGNSFTFNLNNYEIKSFLIEFEEQTLPNSKDYAFATIPFDKVAITTNNNRNSSTLKNKISIPRELIKNSILSNKGINYKLNLTDFNALEFNNQKIFADKNYKYAYLLVLNQGKDSNVLINNKEVFVQNSFDYLGTWDMYGLKKYGYIKKHPQAFTFTHYHKKDKDVVFEDLYLYSIRVEIDSDIILLNKNSNMALLAITYSNFDNDIYCYDDLIDSIEKRKFDYKLNKFEKDFLKEPFDQRIKDIFIDRRKTKYVDWWGGHCYQSPSDFYQIETEKRNFKRRDEMKAKEEENGK